MAVLLCLFTSPPSRAQSLPQELHDPFLDHFVGDWHVERKFGSGRTVNSTLRGEWVLKHHFLARYSALGYGKISADLLNIEFRFDPKDGGLTNRFTFDPQTGSWSSLIRQQENGEWKTFLEEKWTRLGEKK